MGPGGSARLGRTWMRAEELTYRVTGWRRELTYRVVDEERLAVHLARDALGWVRATLVRGEGRGVSD